MKLSLKSTNNKNKSQLNIKQLNSARYNNQDKILSSKKNIYENSKSLMYSNSNLDIKNNINKKKKLASIKNSLNLDNVDESNYKEELYIIPQKITYRKFYTSNIEKTIETYNEIKKEINKKLNKKINYTTSKPIQMQNYSMVNLLEKLNKILDVIVQRSRLTNSKNRMNTIISESQEIKRNKEMKSVRNNSKKISEKVINNRLLNSYKQQFNLLTSKFDSLTKGNYAINLKENITKYSNEITKLEKENRELHRTQLRSELILKNLKTSKNEENYKKKLEEFDKLSIEYETINKHITLKEGELKSNEKRISKLEENKNNLIKKAKEEYNIQNPEEIITEKKDNKETEKIRLYMQRKEIENKILILNNTVKKLVIMEKDNKKFIRQLEEKISEKNYYLKLKKGEIVKLNETLDKIDIENNNMIIKSEINNVTENIENQNIEKFINVNELNKNLKQKNINLSNPDITIEEMNNRYSIKKEKNPNISQVAKTYNKKMILQQLDDQKKREQDGLNRIKLNKKNLKPNFSFSLNNSSRKETNEKNVNLSAAVLSKKNEIEGEIKEDIKIIPYDENIKVKPEEEEQRIITNMSQNITSLEKKEENIIEDANILDENKINQNDISDEKNRQKVLNTLPFYDLEESEKNLKIDEQNNSEGNNNEVKKEDNEVKKEDNEVKKEDNEEKKEDNEEKKEENEEKKEDNEKIKNNEENKENEILDEKDNKNEEENNEYQDELNNMEI